MKKIILAAIVVLILAGGIFILLKNKPREEKISSEITLEASKMMNDEVKLKPAMTEAEKEEIERIFREKGVEMTMLKDVSGGQVVGTGWRYFDGNKFMQKIEASRLPAVGKGFYYEGWLVSDQGFFSIGRMAEEEGTGRLYYATNKDKSEFKGAVVTLEPEDGNPAPDKHILEGNF